MFTHTYKQNVYTCLQEKHLHILTSKMFTHAYKKNIYTYLQAKCLHMLTRKTFTHAYKKMFTCAYKKNVMLICVYQQNVYTWYTYKFFTCGIHDECYTYLQCELPLGLY